MKITQSPCAADALFGTKTITVNGKTVGIARLCDALADVRALGLTRDEELKEALLSRVGKDNYIPVGIRDQYAVALLAEYHTSPENPSGCGGR